MELITAAEVNALLPGGASVTQAQVTAIAEAIQLECGWHIAPVLEETVVLDSEGTSVLKLPTLKMSALVEVLNTATGEPIPIDLATGWSESGLISIGSVGFVPGRSWESYFRPGCGQRFPAGFRAVTVTFTHGFSKCPPDLARFIAQASRQRIIAETLVGRSVTFAQASADIFSAASTLDKYRLVLGS